jgi:hypothetical protein
MSNRLEQEFPGVAWAAPSPVMPGGGPPEVMRACMARGRALRSQAIRDGVRASATALARDILTVIAFVRRATQRFGSREHWPAPRPAFARRRP